MYFLVFYRDRFKDPFLFIIFIADLFFINNDIDFASYADDTNSYICGPNFSEFMNL